MVSGYIAIVSAILALVAAVTGYGVETKVKRRVYYGASVLMFIIAMVATYDEMRPWELSDEQHGSLKKFACFHDNRFPFFVFNLSGDVESGQFAEQVRNVFREPDCEWTGVQYWPNDGWLPQNMSGVYVVWSPEKDNEPFKALAGILSTALAGAGIEHRMVAHSRLETRQDKKVGIVVAHQPNLWEHVFGHGTW